MTRMLFGKPSSNLGPMEKIVPIGEVAHATVLLLFNFETNELHGIFAAKQTGLYLQPDAWTQHRKQG